MRLKRRMTLMGLVFAMLILPVMALALDISASQSESLSAAIIQSSQQLPSNIPVYPYLLQQIPGSVGDVTKEMPNFYRMLPLLNEKVVGINVKHGWLIDRTRLEDIEVDLIKFWKETAEKMNWPIDQMRYRIQYKMNYRSFGSGGGTSGGISAINGGGNPYGGAGSAGIFPGISSTVTDPIYIIKIYKISE